MPDPTRIEKVETFLWDRRPRPERSPGTLFQDAHRQGPLG